MHRRDLFSEILYEFLFKPLSRILFILIIMVFVMKKAKFAICSSGFIALKPYSWRLRLILILTSRQLLISLTKMEEFIVNVSRQVEL